MYRLLVRFINPFGDMLHGGTQMETQNTQTKTQSRDIINDIIKEGYDFEVNLMEKNRKKILKKLYDNIMKLPYNTDDDTIKKYAGVYAILKKLWLNGVKMGLCYSYTYLNLSYCDVGIKSYGEAKGWDISKLQIKDVEIELNEHPVINVIFKTPNESSLEITIRLKRMDELSKEEFDKVKSLYKKLIREMMEKKKHKLIQYLQEENEKMKRMIGELQEEKNRIEEELNNIREENERMKEEIARLLENISNCKEELDEYDEYIDCYERCLKSCKYGMEDCVHYCREECDD